MSGAQRTRRPSTRIQLSPKQANIYTWGWQKDARFRYVVCGRADLVLAALHAYILHHVEQTWA